MINVILNSLLKSAICIFTAGLLNSLVFFELRAQAVPDSLSTSGSQNRTFLWIRYTVRRGARSDALS